MSEAAISLNALGIELGAALGTKLGSTLGTEPGDDLGNELGVGLGTVLGTELGPGNGVAIVSNAREGAIVLNAETTLGADVGIKPRMGAIESNAVEVAIASNAVGTELGP